MAERKLAHLTLVSLSWIHDKNLPRELWAEAIQCACHVINKLPPWPGKEKSPFELLYGEKPAVDYFRVFGAICYVHIPKTIRSKLDPKAKKCIFVGYDPYRKGWKCMDPITKKFVTSRNVVFDEISSWKAKEKVVSTDEFRGEVQPVADVDEQPVTNVEQQGEESIESAEIDAEEVRRSDRRKQPPLYLKDYETRVIQCSVTHVFFTGTQEEKEPSSYEEAKDNDNWQQAMREEIDALLKNETWDLVPQPAGCQPVSCKWVYRLKRKIDGSTEIFKARLVARGFSQHQGLDYEETFSPVAKMATVRTLISLAAKMNWRLWQLDVKNAFLYGELDRDIFMMQPEGFVSNDHPSYVCKLKKALYGLKQAPRAWYGKISQYFMFGGFKISDADSSLFIKNNSGAYIVILLYVDDMIITGSDEEQIAQLRKELAIRFEMKNLGEAKYFLGLEIEKLMDGYFVSQSRYAKNLLNQYQMNEAKKASTPMEIHLKLLKEDGKSLENPHLYRKLSGSLIYLTITRPDLAYSVSVISQFVQKPRVPHWIATKRILRYVKKTEEFGLKYGRNKELKLIGFTDADWAGDTNDRRSTSGHCFLFGSAAITWCSRKLGIVALSSMEAEYMAATLAAQESIWIKSLVGDMLHKVDYTMELFCDNESAIKLSSNPVFHRRTKHIEVHYHFVREKVMNKEIDLRKIHTKEQLTDIFTKALEKPLFEKFRGQLEIMKKEHALKGGVTNNA